MPKTSPGTVIATLNGVKAAELRRFRCCSKAAFRAKQVVENMVRGAVWSEQVSCGNSLFSDNLQGIF